MFTAALTIIMKNWTKPRHVILTDNSNGIPLSKGQTINTHNNLEEFQKHYAE